MIIGSNFLGTTDNKRLAIRTNNQIQALFGFNRELILSYDTTLLGCYYSLISGEQIKGYNSAPTNLSNSIVFGNTIFINKSEFSSYIGTNLHINVGNGGISSGYNNVIGELDTIKTNSQGITYGIINGKKNTINYNTGGVSFQKILGNSNRITGTTGNSFMDIYGYNNQISNSTNEFISIHGRMNSINSSEQSSVFGNDNYIYNGRELFLYGRGNKITNTSGNGGTNFIIGFHTTVDNCSANFIYNGLGDAGINLDHPLTVTGSNRNFIINLSSYATPTSSTNTITNQGSKLLAITNGATIWSSFTQTAGVSLAPGGGSWASVSDRNLKENFSRLSPNDVLNKLVSIPVEEWTYISQRPDKILNQYITAPIHIGPMAQNFSEVFNYGEYKDKITSSDIDGVMFISIQALAQENKILKEKIEALEKNSTQIEELNSYIETLKKMINELNPTK